MEYHIVGEERIKALSIPLFCEAVPGVYWVGQNPLAQVSQWSQPD
jgi:hypothetical protein